MSVIDLRTKGMSGPPAISNARVAGDETILDLADNNLTSTVTLIKLNMVIPANTALQVVQAQVIVPDSATGATIDVGIYKVSDDSAVDDDGVFNELDITSAGTTIAAPAGGVRYFTEPCYVGVKRGSGGGSATFAGAQIRFSWAGLYLGNE